MADAIIEVIQKLGVDATGIYAELDAIKAKYQASNKELEQTQKVLETLAQREAALLQARNRSNNPTSTAKYNAALEQTRKSIEVNERAVKSLTNETQKLGKELDNTEKKMKKAFDTTSINAANKGISGSLLSVAGGLGLATGIGAVVSLLKQGVEDSIQLAAKAEGISTAYSHIGGAETLEKLREATRGAVTDVNLMAVALKAKNFNIPLDLLAKGLKFAGQTARTTGQDVDYLTNSFVDGIGRKSLKILDNLQISQIALQREIKKTGDFNTAVSNVIEEKLKSQGIVVETTSDKIAQLSSTWENFKTKAGEALVDLPTVTAALFGSYSAQTKLILEDQNKQIEKSNGDILDAARKSELDRLDLLSQSSDRIVDLNHQLATTVSQDQIDAINKQIEASNDAVEQNDLMQEGYKLERIKNRSRKEFDVLRLQLQKERELNDDLRKLNQQATADFDDEIKKRLRAERKFLEDLELDIRKAQSQLRNQGAQNSLNSDVPERTKIEIKFYEQAIQAQIDFEKRRKSIDVQRMNDIEATNKDESVTAEAKTKAIEIINYNYSKYLIQLKHLENIELNKLDNQRLTDLRDFDFKKSEQAIEGAKSLQELELKTNQALTTFTLDDADARIAILVEYTSKKIQLMQAEGKDEIDILKFSADQALAIEEIKKQDRLRIQKQSNDQFNEAERKHLAELNDQVTADALKVFAAHRERQSQVTQSEVNFEEVRLKDLQDAYDKEVAITGKQDQDKLLEIEKQENKIAELKRKKRSEERQEIIDQTVEIIDNINQVTDATIAGINKLLDAKVAESDKLISLQQQRVDAVAQIAENGNAELLELEKKRLEDLNKQKEKFVRQQQTLASIELVANTAVAVSKAAAEGGAGAAFTIAAALIALVAGLASARSIAGQAAFFDGGESDSKSGFTGNGNIHETSKAVGPKPYIYHKKEFIFNNETTTKYLNLFRQIHSGDLDLNQMKFEADMYRQLKESNINTSRDVVYRQLESGSASEIYQLKTSLQNIIKAIESQPGMEVHINDEGIYAITNKFMHNKKRVNNLTR